MKPTHRLCLILTLLTANGCERESVRSLEPAEAVVISSIPMPFTCVQGDNNVTVDAELKEPAESVSADEPLVLTIYTDLFKEYYAQTLDKEFILSSNHPIYEPKSIKSPTGIWRVQIVQSNTGIVPYDKTKAAMVINRYDGTKRYVKCERFRTVTVKWINDRLLYVLCNLGHAASVGQILDVESNTWVYQKGEMYCYNEDLKAKQQPDRVR